MFKKIPNKFIQSSCGGVGGLSVETVVSDGKQLKSVYKSSKEVYDLPAVDNFSLKNQLDSGIHLKEVDSKLLIPSENYGGVDVDSMESKINKNVDVQPDNNE